VYAAKGLWMFAGLYVVFFGMAVAGHAIWWRTMKGVKADA
jgi:hypothetical protein